MGEASTKAAAQFLLAGTRGLCVGIWLVLVLTLVLVSVACSSSISSREGSFIRPARGLAWGKDANVEEDVEEEKLVAGAGAVEGLTTTSGWTRLLSSPPSFSSPFFSMAGLVLLTVAANEEAGAGAGGRGDISIYETGCCGEDAAAAASTQPQHTRRRSWAFIL